MNRATLLAYLQQVEASTSALYVARGIAARKEAKHRVAHDLMRLRTAIEQYGATRGPAAGKADTNVFTITLRTSGRVEHITGWRALAERLGFMVSTCRRLVSQSNGVYHAGVYDHATGIVDSATIRHENYKPRRKKTGTSPA